MNKYISILKNESCGKEKSGLIVIKEGNVDIYVSKPVEILDINNPVLKEEVFYKIAKNFPDFLKFISYSVKYRDLFFLFLKNSWFLIIPIFILSCFSFINFIFIYEPGPEDSKNIFYKTAVFRFLENRDMDLLEIEKKYTPEGLKQNLIKKISNKKFMVNEFRDEKKGKNEDEDELFFFNQM